MELSQRLEGACAGRLVGDQMGAEEVHGGENGVSLEERGQSHVRGVRGDAKRWLGERVLVITDTHSHHVIALRVQHSSQHRVGALLGVGQVRSVQSEVKLLLEGEQGLEMEFQ